MMTDKKSRGVARAPETMPVGDAVKLLADPLYSMTPESEDALRQMLINAGLVPITSSGVAGYIALTAVEYKRVLTIRLYRDAGILRFDASYTHEVALSDTSTGDQALLVFDEASVLLESPARPLVYAGATRTGVDWVPELPIGLTVFIGRGHTGKTPILRRLATSIAPVEEADRPSAKMEDIPALLAVALADPVFKTRPIFGIDSLRNLLRTAGGNADVGGFATGAQVFLTDLNAAAMKMGIAIVGVINPNSKLVSTITDLYKLASDVDNGVAGVITSTSAPVERNGAWYGTMEVALRAPLGSRITTTPQTKEVKI